ncbi:translation initiation factor IF-2-like [Mustela erminea]|uniref:translation initiation factor IF-2-like n=1 Tax=Mustela erminea TaxID=36723 RepID=UPI00138670CB|nr:translation initiation factor IF-2-like [Mustela erminea]
MTAAPARARPPRPRPRPRPPPARASARPTLARPPPPPSPPIRRGRFAAQAAAAPPATVVPARRGRAPGLRRGREDSNPPPPDAGAAAGPQTHGPAGLTGRAQAPAGRLWVPLGPTRDPRSGAAGAAPPGGRGHARSRAARTLRSGGGGRGRAQAPGTRALAAGSRRSGRPRPGAAPAGCTWPGKRIPAAPGPGRRERGQDRGTVNGQTPEEGPPCPPAGAEPWPIAQGLPRGTTPPGGRRPSASTRVQPGRPDGIGREQVPARLCAVRAAGWPLSLALHGRSGSPAPGSARPTALLRRRASGPCGPCRARAEDRKTFLKKHRPHHSLLPSCRLGSPPLMGLISLGHQGNRSGAGLTPVPSLPAWT